MRSMECADVVDRYTDYLEDALDADLRSQVDSHLGLCWACRNYVGQVGVTLGLLSGQPAEQPSEELESSLLRLYRRCTTADARA